MEPDSPTRDFMVIAVIVCIVALIIYAVGRAIVGW